MVDLIQKTKEDYDAIAEAFAATRAEAGSDLIQFKPFIEPGQRVLDWGCGNGRLLYLLDEVLTTKAFGQSGTERLEYLGVDQSEEMLKIAKHSFTRLMEDGQVQFFSTAQSEKKFPADFFDVAYLIASLHHLPDSVGRFDLLKQIFYELKPGGRLFVSVWNLESEWAETQKRKWTELAPNDYLIPWKNGAGEVLADRYYHSFTSTELDELVKAAGFTIEKIMYSTDGKEVPKNEGRNIVVFASK